MERENKRNATKILNHIVDVVELCIAFALVCGIVVLFVQMVLRYGALLLGGQRIQFGELLSEALSLVIGIEFTKMLCRHNPDTVIEVLMFATARQLIAEHPDALGIFLGVLSIAVLFVVRKYLSVGKQEEDGFFIRRIFPARYKSAEPSPGVKGPTDSH